jgi:hypothetical protein
MAIAMQLDDPETERLAGDARRARGFVVAARRALVLARRYRTEEGPRGERELACVKQALAWRASARLLRARRPGLARALAAAAAAERRTA